MEDKNKQFNNIPDLSEEMQVELRKEFTTEAKLPFEVGQTVLAGARAHFADIKSRKNSPLRWLRYAAASLILAASVFFVLQSSQTLSPQDVNRDGNVDILDAMTLAIHIRDNGSYAKLWDYNNDNHLTETDVQIVANKAVELNDLDQTASGNLHSQLALILSN